MDKCDKRSTSCTKCDHHVPKNLMYKHLSEDCPGRTTKCEVNGEDMKATALEVADLSSFFSTISLSQCVLIFSDFLCPLIHSKTSVPFSRDKCKFR